MDEKTLSWLLLRERFKAVTGAALLLGFLGVYLIVERSLVPNIPSGGGVFRIIGDLLVALALIFEAFYTVRGKALLVKHSPLLITSAAIVGSVVFWAPVAGWEILRSGWQPLGLAAWIGVDWGVQGTAVPCRGARCPRFLFLFLARRRRRHEWST